MYDAGEYSPLDLDEYIELATFTLTHLRKDFIIHRISGDAPKDILVAPSWNAHKKWIMNGIDKNETRQSYTRNVLFNRLIFYPFYVILSYEQFILIRRFLYEES